MKILAIVIISAAALWFRPTAYAHEFFKLDRPPSVPAAEVVQTTAAEIKPLKTPENASESKAPETPPVIVAEPPKPQPANCREDQWVRADNGQCLDKPKPTPQPAPATIAPTPVATGGTCADWVRQAGIVEVDAALKLIARESGCRVDAYNPSGAYGIPQSLPGHKMASHGADWRTNPITQLRWMKDYVHARYGSFANALAHSYANNWY